jgi:putative sugar O-methyltransferase
MRDWPSVPPAYRLGWQYAEAEGFVDSRYKHALQDRNVDELTACLQGFLRRMPLEGLIEYGRYTDIAHEGLKGLRAHAKAATRRRRFVTSVLHDLRCWSDRVPASLAELEPPDVGSPWGYTVDSTLVMGTAPRHHYYADQVARLVEDVRRPRIAEIGGGFGGFAYCLLAHRCPHASYLDFDLPEVVALESYYLLSAFPERAILLYGEAPLDEQTLERFDLLLMPNFAIAQLPPRSVDLVINSASLSEMHRPTVEQYIADIGRVSRRFFFHDNSDEPVSVGATHEIPASSFPIPHGFRMIREQQSPWFSSRRYRERLLARD